MKKLKKIVLIFVITLTFFIATIFSFFSGIYGKTYMPTGASLFNIAFLFLVIGIVIFTFAYIEKK